MRLLDKDYRKGYLKVAIENETDLWYLSNIIDNGDIVTASTIRKIKLGEGGDRNVKIIKKHVMIDIIVEKIEFHEYTSNLRVSGKVKEGTEDIAAGVYHTINVETDSTLKINKLNLLSYHIDQVKKAVENKNEIIIVCAVDQNTSTIAELKDLGINVISELKGKLKGKSNMKDSSEQDVVAFYVDIMKALDEVNEQKKPASIIIGSPNFWQKYLKKALESYDHLNKKTIFATCSTSGKSGIYEIIKRPELSKALENASIVHEEKIVDELLRKISTNNLAGYGMREVKKAIELGAASDLLVNEEFMRKKKENDEFESIDNLLRGADSTNTKIHLIKNTHEGGKKLMNLGGIAVILRYQI